MRQFVASLIAVLLLSVRLCAAPTNAITKGIGRLPDGLGVNIHFTDALPGEMEMLAEAGFHWVLMVFSWGAIERAKGRYDFAAYDRLLNALDEHHFGTVHYEYRKDQSPVYGLKPSYIAMRALSTALSGCTFDKRLDVGSEDDWALLFHAPDGARLAAWTTSQPDHVTMPIKSGSFNVTGHTGQSLGRVSADAQGLKIRLSDTPQYLAPVGQ